MFIFKVIEGDSEDTEVELNKLAKGGYQFEVIAQTSFQFQKGSGWFETRIVTTVKITKKKEI